MNPWKVTTGILAVSTAFFAYETLAYKMLFNYSAGGYEYLLFKLAEEGVEFKEFDKIALKEKEKPVTHFKKPWWLL